VASVSRIDKMTGLFGKETYKRDYILQKRPIIWSILLIVATPYLCVRLMILRVWITRIDPYIMCVLCIYICTKIFWVFMTDFWCVCIVICMSIRTCNIVFAREFNSKYPTMFNPCVQCVWVIFVCAFYVWMIEDACGGATIGRLLEIIGLFSKRDL